MALTVKVNGQLNGLVHKGSGHMANSTPPDVCKTPSPGGPVPIPYPVIISKSSDLANGTTTVKADGEMVGVKGCEYATCTGDEAGTAGGVVSNTNMKEAKFILYSFDVKMDGQNACRFGDKMTMNHQNTVCLAGTWPTTCKPDEFPLNIDCNQKRTKKERAWSPCMVEELCAKVKAFNDSKKKKTTQTPSPSNAPPGSQARLDYTQSIRDFESEFKAAVEKHGKESEEVKKFFMAECRWREWKDPPNEGKMPIDRERTNTGVNPDHMHDAGLDGDLVTSNMGWLNSRVNGSIGGCMPKFDDQKHAKISPNPNCKCPE
jgi:hypothetical protein